MEDHRFRFTPNSPPNFSTKTPKIGAPLYFTHVFKNWYTNFKPQLRETNYPNLEVRAHFCGLWFLGVPYFPRFHFGHILVWVKVIINRVVIVCLLFFIFNHDRNWFYLLIGGEGPLLNYILGCWFFDQQLKINQKLILIECEIKNKSVIF